MTHLRINLKDNICEFEPGFTYHIYDECQYNRETSAGRHEQNEVDKKNVDN